MHKYNETPLFSYTLFYLDYNYSYETARKIQEILRENGFFPPCYIKAGKRTHNRLIKFRPEMEYYLAEAYAEKETANLQIHECGNTDDCWHINWALMCPKIKQPPEEVHLWNIFTFYAPYRHLEDSGFQARYLQCFCEMVNCLRPFYANMNDMAASNRLSQLYSNSFIIPTRYGVVKAIHWGNYFSETYCKRYGLDLQTDIPVARMEQIGEGIFFTLTDSPLDYSSPLYIERKEIIEKKLDISLVKAAETLDYKGLRKTDLLL